MNSTIFERLQKMYTIVRKFYSSTKDMNPDNPRKIVDVWVGIGCDPLTLREAQIVLPKVRSNNKLWIDQIMAIETKDQ